MAVAVAGQQHAGAVARQSGSPPHPLLTCSSARGCCSNSAQMCAATADALLADGEWSDTRPACRGGRARRREGRAGSGSCGRWHSCATGHASMLSSSELLTHQALDEVGGKHGRVLVLPPPHHPRRRLRGGERGVSMGRGGGGGWFAVEPGVQLSFTGPEACVRRASLPCACAPCSHPPLACSPMYSTSAGEANFSSFSSTNTPCLQDDARVGQQQAGRGSGSAGCGAARRHARGAAARSRRAQAQHSAAQRSAAQVSALTRRGPAWAAAGRRRL